MVEGGVSTSTSNSIAYISTEQLAEMIANQSSSKICILNTSVKPENECDVFREHSKARIPGSRFLDLMVTRDLQSPYPHMMPNQGHFTRMMKALNVRKSQTVVFYETGKGWFASRAAFMLKAYGHPKVYILDGNFVKWQKEGREVESDGDDADATYLADFDYTLNSDCLLSYERMKEVTADGSIQIIENRPPPSVEQTGGFSNSIIVPGPAMLAEDGTIKSATELQELFASKGADGTKPMVMTCMAGVLSSLAYACAIKAGFTGQLYFYDGSWSEFKDKKAKEEAEEGN